MCLYAVSSAENVHGFQLDPIMGICAGAVLAPSHCWRLEQGGGRRRSSSAGCSAGIYSLVPFHSRVSCLPCPQTASPMENSWTFICLHPRRGERADRPRGAEMWDVDLIQHRSEALEKEQGADSPLWSQPSKELIPAGPHPQISAFP